MEFELIPVMSSQIAAVGYHTVTRELVIRFRGSGQQDGPTYSYDGVPPELAAGLIAASSPGSYFHRFIRNAGYPYRRDADRALHLEEQSIREAVS